MDAYLLLIEPIQLLNVTLTVSDIEDHQELKLIHLSYDF